MEATRLDAGRSGTGMPIAGVILAGGLARRMAGADKPLLPLGGEPMLQRVIDRLAPQVERLVISANGDPERFAAFGLPVVADKVEGFAGPLAGLLAGMRWVEANAPHLRWIVSAAADTPFFPRDLVSRLCACSCRVEDTVSLAASPGGTHPVFGVWPVAVADELETFLRSGNSKVLAFADRHLRLNVPFDEIDLPEGAVDPFFNINTPEEAARAEKIAAALR